MFRACCTGGPASVPAPAPAPARLYPLPTPTPRPAPATAPTPGPLPPLALTRRARTIYRTVASEPHGPSSSSAHIVVLARRAAGLSKSRTAPRELRRALEPGKLGLKVGAGATAHDRSNATDYGRKVGAQHARREPQHRYAEFQGHPIAVAVILKGIAIGMKPPAIGFDNKHALHEHVDTPDVHDLDLLFHMKAGTQKSDARDRLERRLRQCAGPPAEPRAPPRSAQRH